jgi:hypothetical protein
MADMAPTVRGSWERVAVVLDAPGVLSFVAAGTIAFRDPSEELLGEPRPFRVTCLAVEGSNGWQLKHFH